MALHLLLSKGETDNLLLWKFRVPSRPSGKDALEAR